MRPEAVLCDVGGIFHLPDHERIVDAFARGGFAARAEDLDRAHYAGAAALDTGADPDWPAFWEGYLDAYVRECGTPADARDEVLEHLRSEFATGSLWSRVVPGSVGGLRELADTGVRLGVISNADGLVGERLREQDVLQVGPGLGVAVECLIDSGVVGVAKPDPRIFRIALEALGIEASDAWYRGDTPAVDVVGARAAGVHPVALDPFGFQRDRGFDTVASLSELAAVVRGERELGAA
jgi:putative hydrolase of the HAD superfamily